MNIAIVEDCIEHSELVKKYIQNWSQKTGNKVSIHQFASAEQFLFFYEEYVELEAVFMDIQMPGLSGVELARSLRETNRELAIVFTTGIDDYIAEGYELEAVHYLMKPVREEKIQLCLDKIFTRQKKKEQYLILNGEEDTFRVKISDIWWVEANGHRVMIHMEDSGVIRQIKAGNSLGKMEEKLLEFPEFIKSHRSYLVNLKHVKSIKKTDLIMDNGDIIPLSRRMYKEVNNSFIRLFV